MKKQTMTRILHILLIVGAVLLIGVFFIGLPIFGKDLATVDAPEFAYAYWPCLIWAWCFAVPIFAAMLPAWRIFSSISSQAGAFSHANARYFRWIAKLAFVDAVIFPVGMLIVASMGAGSPGLIVLGTPATIFACVTVGLVMLILSHLVDEAASLKEDSDLTI